MTGLRLLVGIACGVVIAAGAVYLWGEFQASRERAAIAKSQRIFEDCRSAADRFKSGKSTDLDKTKLTNCIAFRGFTWSQLGLPEPKE